MILVLAFAAAFQVSQAARVPTGTGRIGGRVVAEGEQRQPVASARVMIYVGGWGSQRQRAELVTLTDAAGEYLFEGLAAGTYDIRVEREGFVTFPSTAQLLTIDRRINVIDLAPGARHRRDVTLARAGTIRGQVTDETGAPVPLATISLSTAAASDKVFVGTSATANKNGEYSFDFLPPGSYLVRATPVRTPMTVATYYPGVQDARDAAVVTVSAGDVVTGINIALLAQRSRQLRGHVIGLAGVQADVRLVRSPATLVRTATVSEDGAFSFGPLEDGRYIVTSVAESQGRLAGWQAVDLYDGLPPIDITLQPTGTLRGRIVTNRSDIALDRIYVGAALTDKTVDVDPLLPEKAEVDAEGRFEFPGMFGARTLRLLHLPAGCSLKEITHRGTVVEPPHVSFTGNEVIDDVSITLTCS